MTDPSGIMAAMSLRLPVVVLTLAACACAVARSDESCPSRSELACLESPDCTLHLAAQGSYRCEPAASRCETGFSQRDGSAELCESHTPCRYVPSNCYCRPDVICVCGGGAPRTCVVR